MESISIALNRKALRTPIKSYSSRPIIYVSNRKPNPKAQVTNSFQSSPKIEDIRGTSNSTLTKIHVKPKLTGSAIEGFKVPIARAMTAEQCVKAHVLIAEMESKEKLSRIYEPLEEVLTMPLPNTPGNLVLYKLSNGFVFIKTIFGSNFRYAIIAPIILLLIIGSFMGISGFKAKEKAEPTVSAISEYQAVISKPTNSIDYDEAVPTDQQFNNYDTSPDVPRYIRIPSIKVQSRIKRITTDKDNVLQMPKNIFDTGWYVESSKPGEDGAALIDGHVFGPTKSGIFYYLYKLKIDDIVQVERGDGRILDFKVVGAEVFDAANVDINKVLAPQSGKKKGLNLITQSGSFDALRRDYDKRLVIYTVLK